MRASPFKLISFCDHLSYLCCMAFKKKLYKEIKEWIKNGVIMINPYSLKELQQNAIDNEFYEAAKACQEVFDEWYAEYGYSEEEVRAIHRFHPIYGDMKFGGEAIPELKPPQ